MFNQISSSSDQNLSCSQNMNLSSPYNDSSHQVQMPVAREILQKIGEPMEMTENKENRKRKINELSQPNSKKEPLALACILKKAKIEKDKEKEVASPESPESSSSIESREIVRSISTWNTGPVIELTAEQEVNLKNQSDFFRMLFTQGKGIAQAQIKLEAPGMNLRPEIFIYLIDLAKNNQTLPNYVFKSDFLFNAYCEMYQAALYFGMHSLMQNAKKNCLQTCSLLIRDDNNQNGQKLKILKTCMKMVPHSQKDLESLCQMGLKWEFLLRFCDFERDFASKSVNFVLDFLKMNSMHNVCEDYELKMNGCEHSLEQELEAHLKKELEIVHCFYPNLKTMTIEHCIDDEGLHPDDIFELNKDLFSNLKKLCLVDFPGTTNDYTTCELLEEIWFFNWHGIGMTVINFEDFLKDLLEDLEPLKHLKRVVLLIDSSFNSAIILERSHHSNTFEVCRYPLTMPSWVMHNPGEISQPSDNNRD